VANIIPLAFAAAVYPTLLAGVIILLAREQPAKMLAAFLAGGVLISLTAGLIIVFVLGGSVSTKNQKSASPTVDLVFGVLSILLAVVLYRRVHNPNQRANKSKRKKEGPSWTQRTLGEGGAWAAFGAGVILNLPGIWYLDALKDISEANASTAATIGAILVFIVIMFSLAEAPLIGYVIEPDATRVRVKGFQTWTSAHAMTVATWVAALIGVYLVVKGIVGVV